jgi:effector-binding domain-containing protein
MYQNEQPVLTIETRAELSSLRKVIEESSLKIAKYIEEKNRFLTDVPFVVYHNNNVEDLEIEICFPINEHIHGSGDIKFSVLPEGEIVLCMFQGGHLGRKHMYEEMFKWLDDNGYEYYPRAYEYFYIGDEASDDKTLAKIVIGVTNGPYSQKKADGKQPEYFQ